MSEFGLNVFTSYKSIIPVEYLEFVNDSRNYHIYSILSSPKIRYLKDSFKIAKKHISFVLERQIKDSFEKIEIPQVVFHENLDHTQLILKCDYPYNNLEIKISDIRWLNTLGFNSNKYKILLNAHEALSIFVNEICEFEVLYVG